MANATHEDLENTEKRISKRIDTLEATMTQLLVPLAQQSKGWELLAKALNPTTLVLLVVLVVAPIVVLVGGAPVAQAVVDRYFPPGPRAAHEASPPDRQSQ